MEQNKNMTKLEAELYLFRTAWYEIVERESGQPMPEEIKRKREKAYAILKAE